MSLGIEIASQAFDILGDAMSGLPLPDDFDPVADFEEITGMDEQTNADDLGWSLPGWEPWEDDEPEPLDGFHEDDGD